MKSILGTCILFAEGFLARVQKALRADDPYEGGSPYSEAWLAGWGDADHHAKSRTTAARSPGRRLKDAKEHIGRADCHLTHPR
jgi:hypothetical protein